jgi:hypothetical protein
MNSCERSRSKVNSSSRCQQNGSAGGGDWRDAARALEQLAPIRWGPENPSAPFLRRWHFWRSVRMHGELL